MLESPRIALATGLLRIPPTYFALQHAEALRDEFTFRMHAVGARVTDKAVTIPVVTGVGQGLPWSMTVALAVASPSLFGARQRTEIERFQPHVVHQHFATWSEGPLAAAGNSSAPLITTLHGYDVFALRSSMTGPLAHRHRRSALRTARGSTRLLAVSAFLAQEAAEAGFPADRLDTHYQGIDTEYFCPDPRPDSRRAPHLLFVGALETRKGVDDLLAVARALVGTGLRLRVVGLGSRAEEMRRAAGHWGTIDLLGSLSRAAVRQEMRSARVLMLPTREHQGWREAAGLVLLEAQSCETPVVTFASGGAPEMVVDGETGAVIAEGATDAFVEAVLTFGRLDSDAIQAWGSQARRFVVEHRSLAVSARRLARIYRAVAPSQSTSE